MRRSNVYIPAPPRGMPFLPEFVAFIAALWQESLPQKDAGRGDAPDANQSNKVPLYESVYIARPDISATQVEALTADWTKILEDNGGK